MTKKETLNPIAMTAVEHVTCDTNSTHRDKSENTKIRTYLNSYLNNNNNNYSRKYNNRNEPNKRHDLNDELEELEISLRPSPTDITNIKKFLTFLQNEINKYYKNCYVTPFGSIINGFWMKCSDIDICIQIPLLLNRKDQITFLKKICYILNYYNGGIIEQRFSAKIPIVHFACNDLQSHFKLSCDISINNILAVVNSKLIQKYVSIDRRLQILGIAIKYWAKCRNINDRSKGFLSSFSLILMIIHFLQSVIEPKILPSLQDISVKRNDQSVYIMGIDCKYCQDMNIIKEELVKLNSNCAYPKSGNTNDSNSIKYVDTPSLLIDFFKFYGYKYKSGIIAIRDINAYYDNFQVAKNYDSYFFFVDNPFEVGKNVANILPQNYKIIINEMKRAYKILKNNGTWKDVC
uniref:polynucleotide adenylyltransferase n=1 Tax=Piliocolobus tephrosceles TaxID=591936 RepID=A0A8C9H595_9PRIM